MGAGFRTLLCAARNGAATGRVTIPPPTIWPATPAAMAAARSTLKRPSRPSRVTGTAMSASRWPRYRNWSSTTESLGGHDAGGFRSGLADRMASLLVSGDATSRGEGFRVRAACADRTEKQAPALAALLDNNELSQAALGALARIPGPVVDRTLRDALATLKGNLKIGAVNALGHAATARPRTP